MTPQNVASKVRKVIDMSKEKAILNNAYINPLFISTLATKVPELEQLGFNMSTTETESAEGRLISALIKAPDDTKLNIGSILLDGKQLTVQNTLVLPDDLINFIVENVPKEF